ncbi:hypothetical protein [Sulfuracidifex metallicus]|uniref:hypothetical protein n=1 Tax=Sulfuracidifex metallicus TaxID=47303 RepID=UPI000AEBA7F5|nr:hypothetical protein [Sulfuracidifex metallicus]WOE49976.1 hypothetical protein RQ359_001470 [Sulfuracidifex metallicus DSM 6482 = JCM 9184]
MLKLEIKNGECCKRVIRKVFEGEVDLYIDTVVLLEVANSLAKFLKSPEHMEEELNATL